MPDDNRQRFAPYFRRIADLMRLRDWEIVIKDEPPNDGDDLASVLCVYGQRRALIRLSADFLVDTPERQRATTVHELLHCHLDLPGCIADDEMNDTGKRAYRRALEYAVDDISKAWAEMMPLPDEVDTVIPLNGMAARDPGTVHARDDR